MSEPPSAGTGPDQLSSSDMSSLLNEQGAIHVHVGGTAIFTGEPPPYDEFLAHVGRRLELIPRFRRRVRWLPGRMMRAEWEDDPDFDLRRHVRHLAVPSPGGIAELRELVGQVVAVVGQDLLNDMRVLGLVPAGQFEFDVHGELHGG